jgi:putative membrane protein
MLRRLLIAWLVTAVAVGLTAGMLPGIDVDGGFLTLLWIAAIWAVVNVILGPLAHLIALPLTLLTFGLFAFIVNGALFAVTAALTDSLSIDNFLWAIVGALILSIVTWILARFARVLIPERA